MSEAVSQYPRVDEAYRLRHTLVAAKAQCMSHPKDSEAGRMGAEVFYETYARLKALTLEFTCEDVAQIKDSRILGIYNQACDERNNARRYTKFELERMRGILLERAAGIARGIIAATENNDVFVTRLDGPKLEKLIRGIKRARTLKALQGFEADLPFWITQEAEIRDKQAPLRIKNLKKEYGFAEEE